MPAWFASFVSELAAAVRRADLPPGPFANALLPEALFPATLPAVAAPSFFSAPSSCLSLSAPPASPDEDSSFFFALPSPVASSSSSFFDDDEAAASASALSRERGRAGREASPHAWRLAAGHALRAWPRAGRPGGY